MKTAREESWDAQGAAFEAAFSPLSLGLAATVTLDSTPEEIFAAEPWGYQRRPYALDGSHNAPEKRDEYSETVQFIASGDDVQFDRLLLISQGGNAPFKFDDSAIDVSNDQVIFPGHGLSNGDRVLLRKDPLTAVMFGPMEAIFYWVGVAGDNIQFFQEDTLTTLVPLVAVGAGSEFYLVNARGLILDVLEVTSGATTIFDGTTQDVQYDFALLKTNYGPGL